MTPWCSSYRSFRPRRIAIVSSTLGSPTSTGWNRRSRAASFSMYFLYSSSVVAPMARSSPLASFGFSMFDASTAPCAAPAPTIVCSSSMKRMIVACRLVDLLQYRLQPVLELAPVLRPGEERAEIEGEDLLVLQRLRHVALLDPLRQPFHDGRLSDARLADDDGVVLRAPRQHLHHPPDLVVAPDDRVELPLFRLGGEVPAIPL